MHRTNLTYYNYVVLQGYITKNKRHYIWVVSGQSGKILGEPEPNADPSWICNLQPIPALVQKISPKPAPLESGSETCQVAPFCHP